MLTLEEGRSVHRMSGPARCATAWPALTTRTLLAKGPRMAADDSTKQGSFWDTGEPTKRCCRCGRVRPLEEFQLRIDHRDGRKRRGPYCKRCRDLLTRDWARRNPDKMSKIAFKIRLKKYFGLTVEQYEAMAAAQGGACQICKRPETHKSRWGCVMRLAVDHDHATGKVRGLLCRRCNRMIGSAEEDAGMLRAAANYLERHAD
jgi:hypothetical protein